MNNQLIAPQWCVSPRHSWRGFWRSLLCGRRHCSHYTSPIEVATTNAQPLTKQYKLLTALSLSSGCLLGWRSSLVTVLFHRWKARRKCFPMCLVLGKTFDNDDILKEVEFTTPESFFLCCRLSLVAAGTFTVLRWRWSNKVKPYNYLVHTNDVTTKHMFSDMEWYDWLTGQTATVGEC